MTFSKLCLRYNDSTFTQPQVEKLFLCVFKMSFFLNAPGLISWDELKFNVIAPEGPIKVFKASLLLGQGSQPLLPESYHHADCNFHPVSTNLLIIIKQP